MEDEKKAPLSKAELAAAIKIMENKKRQEALNKASPAALEQKIHFVLAPVECSRLPPVICVT